MSPAPLISSSLKPPVNSSRTVLHAAGEGALAYSRVGEVSRFTQALLHSISGFAGTQIPGQQLWTITGADIYRSVNQVLAADKLAQAVEQLASAELRAPTTFHVETTPTRDFIELNLALWETALRARDSSAGLDVGRRADRERPGFRAGLEPRPVEREALSKPSYGVRVFISCSKADLTMGRKIYRDLKDSGHSPWLAEESLLPGQNGRPSLDSPCGTAISSVTLLSEQALSQRGHFHRELREALELLEQMPPMQTFIVPARVNDCMPPYEELRQLFWVIFPRVSAGYAANTQGD